MQSLGCGYEDFAIYLQDEPGLMGRDANFEAFVARVKQFKAAEPRIQLYANPAGGARADLLRPLQDLIDVWAPDLHLVREQPEELGRIFKHGKQYWHYEAPGDQRLLDPLGFYRVKPWVAFQMGMTGGGYWVYSSAEFWFSQPGAGSEYGSVYPTDRGPVTTKRWEASREGIQDFELLWLLRQDRRTLAASAAAGSAGPARRRRPLRDPRPGEGHRHQPPCPPLHAGLPAVDGLPPAADPDADAVERALAWINLRSRWLASRSDEPKVAVRLQPTGRNCLRSIASR